MGMEDFDDPLFETFSSVIVGGGFNRTLESSKDERYFRDVI